MGGPVRLAHPPRKGFAEGRGRRLCLRRCEQTGHGGRVGRGDATNAVGGPPMRFGLTTVAGRSVMAVEVDGRLSRRMRPRTGRERPSSNSTSELLSDPSSCVLQTIKPGADFDAVRKTLDGVKGVKFPAHQVVSIEFASEPMSRPCAGHSTCAQAGLSPRLRSSVVEPASLRRADLGSGSSLIACASSRCDFAATLVSHAEHASCRTLGRVASRAVAASQTDRDRAGGPRADHRAARNASGPD